MKRIVGILVIVLVLYGLILNSNARAGSLQNHQRLAERLAFYGVMTLGAGMLIVSGGIDLSIGSVFCLAAVSLGLLLNQGVPSALAVLIVLAGGALIGLIHGWLITGLRLQPFVVTLCGLFIWRGLANWLALPDPGAAFQALLKFLSFGLLYKDELIFPGSASNVGIGAREQELGGLIFFSTGYPELTFLDEVPVLNFINKVPIRLWLLFFIAGLAIVFLHFSVHGRYLFAVGANEQAAQYAGIPTRRYKILAYVLCSTLASLAGMLELLDLKGVSPTSTGNWYELYAITGAVLGGCSLRGGEGTIIGILLGTAVLPLLRNLCNFSGLPGDLEFTVIGFALLAGTIVDEVLKRRTSGRPT